MTCPLPFRLLLHGKDGSIPYLTPELTRLMFCPEVECNGNGSDDDDDNDNEGSSDDWRWRREHFILGVAAKDTCVTAVYRTVTTPRKRKADDSEGNDGGHDSTKRAKTEHQPSEDATSTTSKATTTTDQDTSPPPPPFKTDTKPSGYTFITPSQSYEICSHINNSNDTGSTIDSNANGTSNYMHSFLRIPKYISTIIVPTFSLDNPNIPTTLDGESNENSNNKVSKKHESKKPPPQSNNHSKKQNQQQQQQNKYAIPQSTKDSMPINTPHGWQKIKPEQYWDAVISLTQITSSPIPPIMLSKPVCEGAVGLFDHRGIARGQQQQQQRVVQRTNDWSFRVQKYCASSNREQQATLQPVKFWTPVHLMASYLPLNALLARPRYTREANEGNSAPNITVTTCPNVAIVGWDDSKMAELRRHELHKLLATLQSSPSPPQKYLVLSVNDVQSILDIAREGLVSIIGTDLVREWSHNGKALCLDLTFDNDGDTVECVNGVMMGGTIDMCDERYARDSSAILPGCTCLACRPRLICRRSNVRINTDGGSSGSKCKVVPSFSRSYIHHLIKAKEMLAETLLFVHNLHHMLLLFRQLSRAMSLDAEYRRDEKGNESNNFEAFCNRVEEQLKSSKG